METLRQTINETGLFEAVSPTEFESIIGAVSLLELEAGSMIAQEGEIGDACYIILDGVVQVFTNQEEEEIVLAKRERGEFIGEQALLPGTPGRRNASLRAYSKVTLAKITKEDFQRVLSSDSPLKERLFQRGEAQVQDKLRRQSSLFRSLNFGIQAEDYVETTYVDGDIVFREGDPSTDVYLILSGTAGIYESSGGDFKLVLTIKEGRTFGERGILDQQPRSATIRAHGDLTVLRIQGEVFLTRYQQSPEMQEYMQTLSRIFSLGGQGLVTQYFGKFLDQDCLTTVSTLVDGTTILASSVIGQDIFNLTMSTPEDATLETIRYQDPEQDIEREIVLRDAHIVGITAQGYWRELGKAYRMVIDQQEITPEQVSLFQQEGILQHEVVLPLYQPQEIVCDCLQITRGTLYNAIEEGAETVSDLVAATGASTVCGACRVLLHEMVGQEVWTPVHIREAFTVVEGVKSFRLAAFNKSLQPPKPGQHVLVQAQIDGNWIQRPYTISSSNQENTYYEITVKREPHGYFSGWLFDHHQDDALIRISEPQGDYCIELAEPHPIVCLVAGIGMTPALAMCRSLAEAKANRTLHIHYSASTKNLFAYATELEAVTKQHSNIQVDLHATREKGHLSAAEVQTLVDQYPGAHFYICGPTTYQETVEQYLTQFNVPANHIFIEEFKPVGDKPMAARDIAEETGVGLYAPKAYITVGLLLLALFLVQDVFQLKWPWLETLHANESFKRWTGVLLTLYIGGQFILPVLRLQGKLEAAARYYHLHKLQGAFAPLVYFIHSTSVGFAYLFLLSIVFFANFLLGLFNHEIVVSPDRKKTYTFRWLIGHITLSVLTIALVIYHIFIVFAYH